VADSPDGAAEPITIVVADDHAMVRSGLRLLLDAEDDLHVVAEAADIEGALRAARTRRPRVVVLDLNMPGTPTLAAIPSFLEAVPGAAVVVMTMHKDLAFAREALGAGASGHVLKEAARTELVDAVHAAAVGNTYLDPGLGARLAAPAEAAPPAALADLTIGTTFAGHHIDAVAGRGGMAVVYRATDLRLDRPVALKLIEPNRGARSDLPRPLRT
jgi:two-component system response regulator NreC